MTTPQKVLAPAARLGEEWQNLAESWADLVAQVEAVLRSNDPVEVKARKLDVLIAKMRRHRNVNRAKLRRLVEETRRWIEEEAVAAWEDGTGEVLGGALWTTANQEQMALAAGEMWERVVAVNSGVVTGWDGQIRAVEEVSKAAKNGNLAVKAGAGLAVLAVAGSRATKAVQLLGLTAVQKQVNRVRAGTIVYRNGSVHSVGEYMDMLLQTEAAAMRNRGTIVAAAESRLGLLEVSDGPACGWLSHNDPELAHGKIVTPLEASDAVLAHPRCVRSFSLASVG